MTKRHPIVFVTTAAVAAILVAAPIASQEPQQAPRTTFRAAASAVTVDVSVRDKGRRAITGLTASDFQVFDNGVLQQIDQVSYGQLPIDVTVALDVSFSVTGELLESLRRSMVQLMGDLGRDDRLKLMLFNMRVSRTVDFTNDVEAVEQAIRTAIATGGTALYDAVSVALVSASTPDRRQLVVFFTDGRDSTSVTTPDVLFNVAQRSRATLTFVTAVAVGGQGVQLDGRIVGSSRVISTPPVLTQLGTETGGAVLTVNGYSNLSSTFRRILADFRSAYVLYYNAEGVDREGYHALEVKVSREDAVVTARRGYFGSE